MSVFYVEEIFEDFLFTYFNSCSVPWNKWFVLFIPNTRSESSCGQLHKRNMLKEHVLLLKLLLFYKLFCQENVKCQILLQVLHIDEP